MRLFRFIVIGYRAGLMLTYRHWLCVCKTRWNAERQLCVEPFMLQEPLGVLHLSGVDELRAERAAKTALETVTGDKVNLNCRFPGFDGGRLGRATQVRA